MASKNYCIGYSENLLFVEMEDAGVISYRGWRRELLVEEIASASEKKLLLCTLCDGMLRNACCFHLNDKKQARCDACLPANFRIHDRNIADLIRIVVDDRMVHCPFLNEGCKWSGSTVEIRLHLKVCLYVSVPCPLNCFEPNLNNTIQKIQKRLVGEHLRQSCPMRLIPCEYCEAEIIACNINSHFAICLEYPTQCMNKCIVDGEVFVASRKMIRTHLESECSLQQVMCPYSKHGCKVKLIRKDIIVHKVEFMEHHLNIVETNYNDLQIQIQGKPDYYLNYVEDDLTETAANLRKTKVELEKQAKLVITLSELIKSECSPLIWDFPYTKNKAVTNKKFYSPLCYSCGYKFGSYIQINDAKMMVIYFYLLKGKYDHIVEWPLHAKISFVLVNQTDTHPDYTRHIETTDYPLERSFDKPTGVKEIAFCFSDLFSEKYIQSVYLNDDFILIKIFLRSSHNNFNLTF
ncbi:TNF receptor-associated factor 4 [Oopsacas minuta]|uniref:TNF receptor-associated factor 4 n=1 Tax=Oopsacas minuta TaxID=111878 RepID=A0AAV7K509_9METZ|nr:TNF receptor-associated factor 4 [Oopsacas minuta]